MALPVLFNCIRGFQSNFLQFQDSRVQHGSCSVCSAVFVAVSTHQLVSPAVAVDAADEAVEEEVVEQQQHHHQVRQANYY